MIEERREIFAAGMSAVKLDTVILGGKKNPPKSSVVLGKKAVETWDQDLYE